MQESQKSHNSWFDRLTSPGEPEAEETFAESHEAMDPSEDNGRPAISTAPSDGTVQSVPASQDGEAFPGSAQRQGGSVQGDSGIGSGTSTAPRPTGTPSTPHVESSADDSHSPSLQKWHIEELQHRWLITQAQLLDDPREAVHDAGLLIGEAMQLVSATFAEHRSQIEQEWKNNADLDTDELRTIMRRYRDLFKHVLSACKLPDN